MRRRTFTIGLATVAATGVCTSANARTRLSLSTWGSPKHPQVVEFVDRFVAAVKEKSKGEVTFRVFSGGEMVQQQFVPTAVPQGTVDISLTSLETWAGRIPEASASTSPLWPFSAEKSQAALVPGQPVFDYFDAQLQKNGAKLIALFDIGATVLTTRKKVVSPADMKGLTVRTFSKGASELIQALGASPVTMGVGDVYSALQRGAIDGAVGGIQGAVGLKHFEVAKFALVRNPLLGVALNGYVMSKAKWDSLSPEIRDAIQSSATESRNHLQKVLIESYDQYVKVLKDAGLGMTEVEVGSPIWKQWRDALEGMAAKDRERFDPELVKLLDEARG